jgi:glucuronoarabinoxylan endo-1,4-beta-xylanase
MQAGSSFFRQIQLAPWEDQMKICRPVLFVSLLAFLCVSRAQAQGVTINWATTYQEIDGFGASDAAHYYALTPGQAELFFSTTSGAGLSLLRTQVPDDGSCSTVNTTCAGQVTDMQYAISYGARVWSTPWSPPADMKTNNELLNGGSLLTASYSGYANYLANYSKSLSSLFNIKLYAVSIQNEPNSAATWASAVYSPSQMDTFIGGNLGPTFAADGISTLIMAPETPTWQQLGAYLTPLVSNSTTLKYAGIIATHDYNHTGLPAYTSTQLGGKHLWETEVCDHATFDPSIASALTYAQDIHDWLTIANASAWHYWWLIGLNGDNEGLLDSASGVVSKRLYAIGNYSRFVRPGYYRVDATANPQSGIYVSAFKNSSGALVIVAINHNAWSVPVTFTVKGATVSSVTPWVTSAYVSLSEQSKVSLGGSSFTETLTSNSVTTFVGSAVAEPPSNLVATVH